MANKFKRPQAGQLRHIADIEVVIDEQDAFGTPTTNYETWQANVPFDFSDYRVSETMASKEIVSTVLTYLTMRWHPGLTNKMRIRHVVDHSTSPPTADYYDVQGVLRDPTLRMWMQLVCIKRDAAGYRIGTPTTV